MINVDRPSDRNILYGHGRIVHKNMMWCSAKFMFDSDPRLLRDGDSIYRQHTKFSFNSGRPEDLGTDLEQPSHLRPRVR